MKKTLAAIVSMTTKSSVVILTSILSACGGSDNSSTIDSEPLILEVPVSYSVSYTGPTEGTLGYSTEIRDSSVSTPVTWSLCGGNYDAFLQEDGATCALLSNRGLTQWSVADLNINSLSITENTSSTASFTIIETIIGQDYGTLVHTSKINRLPSSSDSHISSMHLFSHGWLNYPFYLSVQTSSPDNINKSVAETRVIITATSVDSSLSSTSDTYVIVDEVLSNTGIYDFSVPDDSALWGLAEPVVYRMVLMQNVSAETQP